MKTKKQKRLLIPTRYDGVYFRYSKKKTASGEADKIFCFWIKKNGKKTLYTVGRSSAGITAQKAKEIRFQIMSQIENVAIAQNISLTDTTNSIPSTSTDNVSTDNISVGEIVELYYRDGMRNGKQFRGSYSVYCTHFKDKIHHIPLKNITVPFLIECRSTVSGEKVKQTKQLLNATTINKAFDFIRAATNYAISIELWNGKNPFANQRQWQPLKENNRRLRFLSQEEVKTLLKYLKSKNQQAHDIVILAVRTGLRPTEIFRLQQQDIDANANVLYVLQKGGSKSPVKIEADITQMLLKYNRLPQEYIFQTQKGTKLKETPSAFKKAVVKLGMQSKDSLYRVTLHTLRHTFASWLAQSGEVSLIELQKLMRHQSIQMTMRYAHLVQGQECKKLSIIRNLLS